MKDEYCTKCGRKRPRDRSNRFISLIVTGAEIGQAIVYFYRDGKRCSKSFSFRENPPINGHTKTEAIDLAVNWAGEHLNVIAPIKYSG